jgi:hypothetical protein
VSGAISVFSLIARYMASDDPEFEKKAADIIGLYIEPPVNAAVFCLDEKSAIQALDRLDPVLPLSPESGAKLESILSSISERMPLAQTAQIIKRLEQIRGEMIANIEQ